MKFVLATTSLYFGMLALFSSPTAVAATAVPETISCAAIKAPAKRLKCFDSNNSRVQPSTNSSNKHESVRAASSPIEKKLGALSLEVGVVFASGDVKPVARTPFYLLNESLSKIFQEAGIRAPASAGSEAADSMVAVGYFGSVHSMIDKLETIRAQGSPPPVIQDALDFHARGMAAIQSHIVQQGMTDFGGRLKFEPVEPGPYYVIGVYKTPKGAVTWNLKVAIDAGDKTVLLDQNNANSAK